MLEQYLSAQGVALPYVLEYVLPLSDFGAKGECCARSDAARLTLSMVVIAATVRVDDLET